jgi:hypothetical protein
MLGAQREDILGNDWLEWIDPVVHDQIASRVSEGGCWALARTSFLFLFFLFSLSCFFYFLPSCLLYFLKNSCSISFLYTYQVSTSGPDFRMKTVLLSRATFVGEDGAASGAVLGGARDIVPLRVSEKKKGSYPIQSAITFNEAFGTLSVFYVSRGGQDPLFRPRVFVNFISRSVLSILPASK